MPGLDRAVEQQIARAIGLHRAGKADSAVEIYKQIANAIRREPKALRLYAMALCDSGETNAALAQMQRALKLAPIDAQLRVDHSRLLITVAQPDEALREAERALAIDSQLTQAISAKAAALRRLGRSGEIYPWISSLIAEREQIDSWLVGALADAIPGSEDPDETIRLLRKVLGRDIDQDEQRALLFRLGELLDANARYDEAFDAFKQANDLKGVQFDAAKHHIKIKRMLHACDEADRIESDNQSEPIFIVGMPRSGTSLVEQVLSAHPAVAPAGETTIVGRAVHELGLTRVPFGIIETFSGLSKDRLNAAARNIWNAMRTVSKADPNQRITEKMPSNIMYVGILSMLFPRARFILCERDLRDTGLSCYFHDFMGLHKYSYDVRACAAYGCDVRLASAHWQNTLPDRTHEARYERMVCDFEPQVRAMLDFLGLPFDKACLSYYQQRRKVATASFDQVNKPIYSSSVGRWKNYESHLGPMLDELRTRDQLD